MQHAALHYISSTDVQGRHNTRSEYVLESAMPDPIVFPVGATITAFTMAAIGWYAVLRAGVQLVHDDWKAAQKYKQDIGNIIIDLSHQERGLERWKNKWMISKHTPDEIFSTYWGEEELRIIQHKLSLIETNSREIKKELERITNLKEDEWTAMSDYKKKRKAKFIWTKKSYIQKLIDKVPESMGAIEEAANRGWEVQKERLYRGIANNTPYHTQIAQLLVKIAKQTRHDLNALCLCTRAVRELSIELDLDLFDAIAAISKDIHSATVAAVAAAGHMRLDLLLRESESPTAEMVRARVERSLAIPDGHARATDAFKSVMTAPQASIHYFAFNTSTIFSLCKSSRKGDPCSPTRESLRQKISRNAPPSYEKRTNELRPCKLILGDLSTFRVAYELSQACLIFLRTTWISEVCGCGLRCGGRQFSSTGSWYEFGLNMETIHQPPRWHNPYTSSNESSVIEGSMSDSWCMTHNSWNAMNKPLRRLGLLLLEITLGTIVMKTESDETSSVTHVSLLVRGTPPAFKIQKIRLEKALALVANAVHGSNGFSDAVKCCLTRVIDQAPVDAEWEDLLKTLYFDIVKP